MSGGPEGSLAELDLPRFLSGTFRDRATGVLRAVRGNHVTEVFFRQGWIIGADSNDDRDELGRMLVRARKIQEEQLRLARDTMEQVGSLAARLSHLGFLTPQEIASAERQRVAQVVSKLLLWDEGTWRWFEETPVHPALRVHLNPLQVVLGLFLEAGNPEAAVRVVGNAGSHPHLGDDALVRLSLLDLPEEFDLLAVRLDGRLSVEEAARESGVEREDALRFCHALSVLDLLEPESSASAAAGSRSGDARMESRRGSAPDGRAVEPPGAESAVAAPSSAEASRRPAGPVPPPEGPTGEAETEGEEGGESLVEEVMARGTLVEVLFSVALLAAVFAGVLYMGRHYLRGLREGLDETRLTRQVPSPESDRRAAARAFPPGSARRVLSEVDYRLLDEEPPPEDIPSVPALSGLLEDPIYQAAVEEFRVGNYGRAAARWAAYLSGLPPKDVSLRVARACDPAQIRQAAGAAGPGFLVVAAPGESGSCFLVLWGVFPDEETARREMSRSPGLRVSFGRPDFVAVGDLY